MLKLTAQQLADQSGINVKSIIYRLNTKNIPFTTVLSRKRGGRINLYDITEQELKEVTRPLRMSRARFNRADQSAAAQQLVNKKTNKAAQTIFKQIEETCKTRQQLIHAMQWLVLLGALNQSFLEKKAKTWTTNSK